MQHPSAPRPGQRWLLVLVLAGAMVVVVIAIWPTPIDRPLEHGIRRVLGTAHALGVPTGFGYAEIEMVANVGFYSPLGAVLGLAVSYHGRSRWWAVVVLASVSTTVEIVQSTMPLRVGSVSDVAANTVGAALGVLGTEVVRRMRNHRRASVAKSSLMLPVPTHGVEDAVLEVDRGTPTS